MVCLCHQASYAQTLSSKQDEKTILYGIVDEEGKYIVPAIYKELDFNFGFVESPLYTVTDKNDKIGYINNQGKVVIACKYDRAASLEMGYAIVGVKVDEYSYKQGLIDSTGKEVLPLQYPNLEYYPKDRVLVFSEQSMGKVGVMDLKGNILIKPQYEFWSKDIYKGLWPVVKGDSCGVVNLKNEMVMPFIYESIESFSEYLNIATAKKAGKYGFIDLAGKVIVPFIYEEAWPSSVYMAAKKEGKWGVIDKNNKVILPFEYADITTVTTKTAWVIKKEKEEPYEVDLATGQKVKQ